MRKFILSFLGVMSIVFSVNAKESICKFSNCIPNHSEGLSQVPSSVPTYNDLTKASGGFDDVYQDKVIIRGRIVDKNCLPVSDAKIELWQRDAYGIERYISYPETSEKTYIINKESYSEFQGVGSAVSDNEGMFIFSTVMPSNGKNKSKKDDLNLKIKARGFRSFSGKVSFDLKDNKIYKKRKIIPILTHLNQEASDLYNLNVYDITIVMDGFGKKYRY